MNQKNPKTDGFNQGASQFDSGFGGSGFGGGGNSQFGGGAGGGGQSEFGGGFGGTNAVSQIFKDGGFDDSKRKRIIIISAALLAVAVAGGAAWWLFSGEDAAQQEVAKVEQPVADAAAAEDAAAEEDEAAEDEVEDEAAPVAVNSGSFTYDARQGGIVINATAGARITVSRSADFSDTYVTGVANGGKFQIPLPPPGKIFWREEGNAEAHEITINPPPSLGLTFSAPQSVAADGQLSWSASGPVSFYRLEFATDAQFGNTVNVISTSQTSAAASGVTAGKYFVRVGGFNLAAGRFEYSAAHNITVE